jgi:hypothetical protein
MKASAVATVLGGLVLVGTVMQPTASGVPGTNDQDDKCESSEPAITESKPRPVSAEGALLDGDHVFGDGVAFENLTVWPVHVDLNRDVGDFLTLTEAAVRGVMKIGESGRHGLVSTIEISNRAPVPILACAGTLLQGGKQDRVLSDDVVIAPKSTVAVRVFCVERRRWSEMRQGVDSGGAFVPSGCKATKRVRVNAQYKGSQSAVWDQTRAVKRVLLEETAPPAGPSLGQNGSQYYLSSTFTSGTGSFFNVLDESVAKTRATRRLMAAAVEQHLEREPENLVGFAYAVDGEPVSVRTFANPELFRRRMHSFIRTMCLEAEVARRAHLRAGRPVHSEPANIEAVVELVRGLRQAAAEATEIAPGCRVSKRANGFGGSSTCSILVRDGSGTRWVELTQDWTAPLEYGKEAREILGKLHALGYTR